MGRAGGALASRPQCGVVASDAFGGRDLNEQLPLDIGLRDDVGLEDFVVETDPIVPALLADMAGGRGESQLLLWGACSTGKSHLLQATCRAAGRGGRQAAYVPLRLLGSRSPEIVDGLEQLDLVALDDIDAVAGRRGWELGLFDLINRARATACRLLLAASSAPGACGFGLRDLVSRLGWGPVFQLQALSDDAKAGLLMAVAERRGLRLGREAADFMMTRYRRDLPSLLELLDRLDRASLASRRAVTVPLIRELLSR